MTPTRQQLTALRKVGETRAEMDKAAAAHHAAMVRALSLGVTQSQLALELDVTRQSVHEYVHRWIIGSKTATADPRQGRLL